MQTLQYKVIKNKRQYKSYCDKLEQLIFSTQPDRNIQDEIGLLTLLIEKWDAEHLMKTDSDPIQLLKSFLDEHEMKAKDLVDVLGVSKGYISDILHYKKGLSKVVIRKLANHFKVSQDALNRSYPLVTHSGKSSERPSVRP
jgi:HTH-type transcriptional regulator/antitoxin HigA